MWEHFDNLFRETAENHQSEYNFNDWKDLKKRMKQENTSNFSKVFSTAFSSRKS